MTAICCDCGVDTTPCTHRRGCRHAGRWERYVVSDVVWREAGGAGFGDRIFWCVGCLERRLGRKLAPEDFADVPINDPDPWDTVRLAARKAGLDEGVLVGRWPP